jgi:UDP-glucuronate 4-epimerase
MPLDGSEMWSSPIATEDIVHFLPGLFAIASTAPTIVNRAGDEAVMLRTFVTELAQRAGLTAEFVLDDRARAGFVSDNTRRRELLGACTVDWREGMARAVEAHIPGAFSGQPLIAGEGSANIWGAT